MQHGIGMHYDSGPSARHRTREFSPAAEVLTYLRRWEKSWFLCAGVYQRFEQSRLGNLRKLHTGIADINRISIDYSDRQKYVGVIVGTRYHRHARKTPNLSAHQ